MYCRPLLADLHLPIKVTSALLQPATTVAVLDPLFAEWVEYTLGSNPAALIISLQLECKEL
jgi:hypothetical protein